jgi:hypothetical protein
MRARGAFFVAYNCPHCGVALEADDDGWDGWRRCPACARLALPPKIDPRLRLSRTAGLDASASAEGNPGDDGLAGPNGASPEQLVQGETVSSAVIGPARLIFKTGFILALALLLISYLDQQSTNTVIFGALAVICFLLLLRFPKKGVTGGELR